MSKGYVLVVGKDICLEKSPPLQVRLQ
jgi:hypothetical protein